MAVVALLISILALAVSTISALFARRKAQAAEQANWLAMEPAFLLSIDVEDRSRPDVILAFDVGPPSLESVSVELVEDEESPVLGFGVGSVDSQVWDVGPMKVGDVRKRRLYPRPEPVMARSKPPARSVGGSPAARASTKQRLPQPQ